MEGLEARRPDFLRDLLWHRGACDDYIKDDKRKIYRCKKNIEKELKKIIKDNRSHNGLERSEWQAVYSENISRGQLN